MRFPNTLIALLFLLVFTSCEKKSEDSLTVKLDNLTSMSERTAKIADMREFLWEHWHNRKCGKLMLTAVSKEGSVSHSEYRISMIPVSTMRLRVTGIRDHIGYQGQVIPRPTGEYETYMIDRVISENPYGVGEKSKVTVLPDDAILASSKFWLRFEDWNGNLIGYF
jgi:hypothetical protein